MVFDRFMTAGLLCATIVLWWGCSRSPKTQAQIDDSGFIPDQIQARADDNFGFVPDLIQPHKPTLWDRIEDIKYSLSNFIFGEKEDMTPYWNNYFQWQRTANSSRSPRPRPLDSYSPEQQRVILKARAEKKAKQPKMSETERLLHKTYARIEDMNREMGNMRGEIVQMRQTIRDQAEALDDEPTEPTYVRQYKAEMAMHAEFARDMDRINQRSRANYYQAQPDLSGIYYNIPLTGPNNGNVQFNYIGGPY